MLLAIPLGILTNLLTPKVQAWFALRSKRYAPSRAAKLDRLLRTTERMVTDPVYATASFAVQLLIFMIGIALLFLLMFVFLLLFIAVGSQLTAIGQA